MKSENESLPVLFFFLSIALATLDPLQFHKDFRIGFLISTQKSAGLFIGIMLSPKINLGRGYILTILNLLFLEHGMSLHLFRFLYLNTIVVFSVHAVKFVTVYFIYLNAIESRIKIFLFKKIYIFQLFTTSIEKHN